MAQIRLLSPHEQVWLDQDRLQGLKSELGEGAAEDVVCRAMEELAARLAQVEKRYRAGEGADMVRLVRSLVAIAEQVGMDKLARVAGDVCECAKRGDPISLAATVSRLIRIGERSLHAIWEADEFCP